MKRIKSIGLWAALILLVFSLALGCKQEVEDDGDSVPVPNPHFTVLDTNYNTGAKYWNNRKRINSAPADTDIYVDTTVKRGNSNSLRVNDNGFTDPWARTWVFVEEGGVKVGSTYELTAWIRTDGSATGRIMAQFFTMPATVTKEEVLNTPEQINLGTFTSNITSNGVNVAGQWVKEVLLFPVPSGTGYVEICVYNLGAGTVWYTDFELKEVK